MIKQIQESHQKLVDSQKQNEFDIRESQDQAINNLKIEFESKIDKNEEKIKELNQILEKQQQTMDTFFAEEERRRCILEKPEEGPN